MNEVGKLCAVGLAFLFSSTIGVAQNEHRPNDLTLEKLTALRTTPPAGITSLSLSIYQRKMPTHSMLTLLWDSLPGRDGIVSREEAERSAAGPGTFTLLKQLHGQPAYPEGIETGLAERLVIFGVTKSGELRCAKTIENPRIIRGEDFSVNPAQRHDGVTAKTTFDVWFCDDPSMVTIYIAVRDDNDATNGMLKLLGSVAISSETPH